MKKSDFVSRGEKSQDLDPHSLVKLTVYPKSSDVDPDPQLFWSKCGSGSRDKINGKAGFKQQFFCFFLVGNYIF